MHIKILISRVLQITNPHITFAVEMLLLTLKTYHYDTNQPNNDDTSQLNNDDK